MATQSQTAPLDEAAVIRNLSFVSVFGNAVLSASNFSPASPAIPAP